jgi:hypothetical protein
MINDSIPFASSLDAGQGDDLALFPSGDRVCSSIAYAQLQARRRGDHALQLHLELGGERMRVDLNGRRLGEALLQTGWRAYVFPTIAADFRSDGNVLAFRLSGEGGETTAPGTRHVAFSELTLHGTGAPERP